MTQKEMIIKRSIFHACNSIVVVLFFNSVCNRGRGYMGILTSTTPAVGAWISEYLRTVNPKWANGEIWCSPYRFSKEVSRACEATSINSMTWFITAMSVIAILFDGIHCMTGVVVLGFGDPVAAWCGRYYGKHRFSNGKSVEGLLAFILISVCACMLYYQLYNSEMPMPLRWQLSTVASIAGGIAELCTDMGTNILDDNFTIPVTAAFATWCVLGNGSIYF